MVDLPINTYSVLHSHYLSNQIYEFSLSNLKCLIFLVPANARLYRA